MIRIILILVIGICQSLYSQQFQFKWQIEVNGYSQYLGDIDGDGIGEFFNQGDGGLNFYSGLNGSLKFNIPNSYNYYIQTWYYPERNIRLCDIDYNNNGIKDIYVNSDNSVKIVDPSTAEVIFEYYYLNSGVTHFGYLGDFDNDGILDIAISDYDPSISSGITRVYSTGIILSNLEDGEKYLPKNFILNQNFPNPFNPSTIIRYSVPEPQNVSIKIYDITGQIIKEVVKAHNRTGNYEIIWDGTNNQGNRVSSGTYFYQLVGKTFTETKKMLLIK